MDGILNWQQGNEKRDAVHSVRWVVLLGIHRGKFPHLLRLRGECGPGKKQEAESWSYC